MSMPIKSDAATYFANGLIMLPVKVELRSPRAQTMFMHVCIILISFGGKLVVQSAGCLRRAVARKSRHSLMETVGARIVLE